MISFIRDKNSCYFNAVIGAKDGRGRVGGGGSKVSSWLQILVARSIIFWRGSPCIKSLRVCEFLGTTVTGNLARILTDVVVKEPCN